MTHVLVEQVSCEAARSMIANAGAHRTSIANHLPLVASCRTATYEPSHTVTEQTSHERGHEL